jgi:hypothetical protein
MARSTYIAGVQHEGQTFRCIVLRLTHSTCDGPYAKVVVKVISRTSVQEIEQAGRLHLHVSHECADSRHM